MQTSLFHERKQETVDNYAEDLKSKFHKVLMLPRVWDNRYSHLSLLLDLLLPLNQKWQVWTEFLMKSWLKARFEEAKLCVRKVLLGSQAMGQVNQCHSQSSNPLVEASCWSVNSVGAQTTQQSFADGKGRLKPRVDQPEATELVSRLLQLMVQLVSSLNPDLDEALSKITTIMHTITSQLDC